VSAARTIVSRPAVPAPRVPTGGHEAEQQADLAGEAAARRTPVVGWSFASVPPSSPARSASGDPRVAGAIGGSGRPLEPAPRRALELQLGADLSAVRLHDDPAAAAATRAVGAEGLALGDDVALATGRHDPASPRSRALLAHELAHVVQQRGAGAAVQLDTGGAVTPATTLDGLPEADRKRIQAVTTTQVTVPGIAEKFATKGTTVTSAFPSGVTAAFDTSVDAALQHGLTNVAGSLSAGTELTPLPLPPNSTVTLELDVPSAGKGLYRFTYHVPPAPTGGKGPAPAPRIIVEALGKATAPAGTKAPAPPAVGATAAPDPVADKIKTHSISQSYSGTDLDALRAALDQIPDAQLAVVDGLRFARDTADPTDPKAGGHYDPKTHTVTMFDRAFAATQTRSKTAGPTASDGATRAIVHEIGHAIDLAAVRKAGLAQDKADKAVAGLSTKYPDPNDPTGFQFKKGTDEEKDVKATLKAQTDAEASLLATRSLSGTKTVKKPGGDFGEVIGADVKGSKFREAAAKDGGKAVSAYGDTDFQEAFAEAYSLYITSPDTLKTLRPNVFDYLDKNLPK
jgi:hypothetical protein